MESSMMGHTLMWKAIGHIDIVIFSIEFLIVKVDEIGMEDVINRMFCSVEQEF